MLIDTERLSYGEARNGLGLHPSTATVLPFWVLPEHNMLEKVESIRADLESCSEQLMMITRVLSHLLK